MSNKFLQLATRTSSGVFIVFIVVLSRLIGILEPLELVYFDLILKARPHEPQDNRIVLIEIDSVDPIKGTNSKLSAKKLVNLVTQIQTHQPTVIGFNILRDLIDDSDPSFQELSDLIAKQENIISAESFVPPFIYPLPGTNLDNVGFVNLWPDSDNYIRRMLLGSHDFQDPAQFKFSFSLLLAKFYLEKHGHILTNGERDPTAMQFGDTEIPLVSTHTGGYNRNDDAGVQTIVNYRRGKTPFKAVKLENLSKELTPQLVKDKIVIIGVTDSNKRLHLKTPVNKKMNGLYVTAHFTSHITSAVMDGRPLIKSWKEIYEYAFIILFGISIVWFWDKRTSLSSLIFTKSIILFLLLLISYILLIFYGYWLAVVSPILILCLNSLVYFSSIYKDDMRRKVIERTFEIIHNGPLQSLAIILNELRSNHQEFELEDKLTGLSQEIRKIGDDLLAESLSHDQILFLNNATGDILDLDNDLHELFYQIYSVTLKRDFSNFQNVKTKIRSFENIPIRKYDFSLKRELCRYLEEAICNVGKHSIKPTQLIVTGKALEGFYILTVKDNGIIQSTRNIKPGKGTKSAIRLAKKLKGKFNRDCSPKKGTICQLKWRL